MDVTHFNSFLRGGAATAARQLHRALREEGINSSFQYQPGQRSDQSQSELAEQGFRETHWKKDGLLEGIAAKVRFRLHRQKFKRETAARPEGAEVFTSPHGKPSTRLPAGRDPSRRIVHLHWIAKFIDYPSFFGSLPAGQPVVWTLHDMNALTGGCHFSSGCERFRNGCGSCPQLVSDLAESARLEDVSHRSFRTKQRALEDINLHVVAPSRWLLEQARHSPILENAKSFRRIPYGMPVDRLFPVDREEARRHLGIEADQFVIAFGAMNLASLRKGAAELHAALKQLKSRRGISCLMFGAGTVDPNAFPLPVHHAGFLSDDHQRRLAYSAADVFVLPSLEDNLPLTGMESMACGTPVIGFASGGIPDYVTRGETGWLASRGSESELASCLEEAINNTKQVREFGKNARRAISQSFRSDLEAKAYQSLYEQLIGDSASADLPIKRAA